MTIVVRVSIWSIIILQANKRIDADEQTRGSRYLVYGKLVRYARCAYCIYYDYQCDRGRECVLADLN